MSSAFVCLRADVEGGDDEVVAGQELVLEVEPPVGPDLELAAVQQAEALGRRRRPGARPASSSRANRAFSVGHDPALQRDPVRGQAPGDGQRLAVVGQDLVGVTARSGGLGHRLDRVDAVGPVGVAVEVAPEVGERHEVGQPTGQGGLDLAPVLAQLGLDERQVRGTRTPRPRWRTSAARRLGPVAGSPSSSRRR